MKNILLTLALAASPALAKTDAFKTEASALAKNLRETLMKELSKKMAEGGPTEAVPFCHENVRPLAKSAAKDFLEKFEFGRTSHKVRNPQNAPKEWMVDYLERFKGTKAEKGKDQSVVHVLPDGKRAYLEPLYVQPLCLNCHGPSVAKAVQDKIQGLYPQDKATGFNVGDFRGFIWVKEK